MMYRFQKLLSNSTCAATAWVGDRGYARGDGGGCGDGGGGGGNGDVPAAASRRHRVSHGRAVQVDPIKHTFKAPGPKNLKLEYDHLLSTFAFNFCFQIQLWPLQHGDDGWQSRAMAFLGRAVQVETMKLMLKAPGTKHLKL
jgi:hypothetical protein